MLDAARHRFVLESYENVGLRDIAGDVGVDVALVSRYFGNKEELFREVLGVGSKQEMMPPELANADMPEYLARLFMQEGADGNVQVERLLIILRSASSPRASELVRDAFRNDILRPLAEKIGGNNADLRASNSMAVWMGMAIVRIVMAVEPPCEGDLQDRLRRLFEAALADV